MIKFNTITFEPRDRVAIVTLNRPHDDVGDQAFVIPTMG
jgi:hypothetical protein